MNLLVAGGHEVDAGKTTFSVGLVSRLDAVGFKPRAGNDYWFDHDDYRRAVDAGRLYGKDAERLAAAGTVDRKPEDVNPIHRLWQPAPGAGAGLLGREDRRFVVDRVGAEYVVNAAADVPNTARERLPLEAAIRVESLPEFNAVMERVHVSALQELAAEIDRTDPAVVESYSDIARPLRGFDPDAVAVVEPTRARIYDGQRYVKGCEVVTGGPGEGQLEERATAVTDLLDPVATARLPPLVEERRSDPGAIADAYEPAYEALLTAAVE